MWRSPASRLTAIYRQFETLKPFLKRSFRQRLADLLGVAKAVLQRRLRGFEKDGRLRLRRRHARRDDRLVTWMHGHGTASIAHPATAEGNR